MEQRAVVAIMELRVVGMISWDGGRCCIRLSEMEIYCC